MQASEQQTVQSLTKSAQQIIHGDYKAAQQLFEVAANATEVPEYRELAETLGMMSVKVEAREFDLEYKIEKIEQQSKELEHVGKLRAESGFLFCAISLMLSAYTAVVSAGLTAGWISARVETLITVGLLLALLGIFGFYTRRHRHAWAIWGFTWKGSARALRESLLWCVPGALALIGLKGWLIGQSWSPFFGHPLFNWKLSWWIVIMYFFLAVAQEIISRGFLQTTIERILTGRYRGVMAVFTTSVLFAVVHLHYSAATMLATMVAGLFFGWLYRRHQTLVGVSVAHFLLGTLALDILRLIG
ncbi:MAG: type II CAAX endopeptidase family protein [Verrucomicrobiota bacterium]